MAIDNCEDLHPTFGCERMNYAKELMCYDHVDACQKQCCFGCTEICGYRCFKESNYKIDYDTMDETTLMALMMAQAASDNTEE